MIELIPAIDIIEGKCVRLTKGDYAQKTVYGDPLEMAREFERIGYRRLHVVDLDGAKSRHIVNKEVLRKLACETNLIIDFGGGIKSNDDIKAAFDNGASMVTVGSVAVVQPDLFGSWLETYGPERMILGADVRNGLISINGWKDDSMEELLHRCRRQERVVYRDIEGRHAVRSCYRLIQDSYGHLSPSQPDSKWRGQLY